MGRTNKQREIVGTDSGCKYAPKCRDCPRLHCREENKPPEFQEIESWPYWVALEEKGN